MSIMDESRGIFLSYSELKAKFKLVWLVNKKTVKEKLQFKNSHEYSFEHDVNGRKCCYNQRERKNKARIDEEKVKFRTRRGAVTSMHERVGRGATMISVVPYECRRAISINN